MTEISNNNINCENIAFSKILFFYIFILSNVLSIILVGQELDISSKKRFKSIYLLIMNSLQIIIIKNMISFLKKLK